MYRRTANVTEADAIGPSTLIGTNQLGLTSLLLLSAWFGLVAGLLEVGAMVLRQQIFDANQIPNVSRHFIWLIPLSNLGVVLTLGLLGSVLITVWPSRGHWLVARGLGATVFLPAMLVAFPRIYTLAWLAVALGIAARVVPLIERRSRDFRRFVLVSFPAAVAIVAMMGTSLWVGDLIKQRRENERPLPAPGSPNVLLIVLDTVAAGHLSLHGYDRPTSTTLVELAERGIQFDAARAPSSWTLPSHATMFTGRWLHELSVGWVTPLDRSNPTLAEFLGDRGYATAGFVANTGYCQVGTGLSRGFTRYQDFIFPELTALKMAVLVNRALEASCQIAHSFRDWLEPTGMRTYFDRLVRSLDADRKGAAVVNRELLDWLSYRPQPERPFLAFLNYNDAHYPYELPPGRLHRFGAEPAEEDQRYLIRNWGDVDKTIVSPAGVAYAAACYDDCIADLDEQLGKLFDQLDERGDLEQTWVIIASDHGESFGEHHGYFGHSTSLYDTEVHVPLIIIPPGGRKTKLSVKEAVSLRDLPATIVDVTGQATGTPFPGGSLARFWQAPISMAMVQPASVSPSLSEVVPDRRIQDEGGRAGRRVPTAALKDSKWSYISRAGDDPEQLFDLCADPKEQNSLARDPSAQSTLKRMRAELERLLGGPLVPGRFGR